MRAEAVQRAVLEVPRHDAAAGALLVHDQVEREILDEELGIVAQALLIERVDDRVAGAVGGGAGALAPGRLRRTPSCGRRTAADRSGPSSVRENGTPKCSSSMTAGIALRHMYSIASWSPSQSEPLTVSYMCQRQSSSPILPSAALMPPCAATVWLRVGKTLLMQAVLQPCDGHARGRAQPGAAGADDDDVVAVIGDLVGRRHAGLQSAQPSEGDAAAPRRCRRRRAPGTSSRTAIDRGRACAPSVWT